MKGTIKAHRHFKFVMNNGKKTVAQNYIMFSMSMAKFIKKFKGYEGNNWVYGIMTTKKLGNAVRRNYIKRKLRVEIRTHNFTNVAVVFVGRQIK